MDFTIGKLGSVPRVFQKQCSRPKSDVERAIPQACTLSDRCVIDSSQIAQLCSWITDQQGGQFNTHHSAKLQTMCMRKSLRLIGVCVASPLLFVVQIRLCAQGTQSVHMGWSNVSSGSESSASKLAQPKEDPTTPSALSTSASSDRPRSRSPRLRRMRQALGIEPRPEPLTSIPGTQWWAPVVEQSMAHVRDELPSRPRPLQIESACSGTLAEVWICQAFWFRTKCCNIAPQSSRTLIRASSTHSET